VLGFHEGQSAFAGNFFGFFRFFAGQPTQIFLANNAELNVAIGLVHLATVNDRRRNNRQKSWLFACYRSRDLLIVQSDDAKLAGNLRGSAIFSLF
jgi:hypothetical protein